MKNTIYVNPGKKKRISILPYILREYPKVCVNLQTDVR